MYAPRVHTLMHAAAEYFERILFYSNERAVETEAELKLIQIRATAGDTESGNARNLRRFAALSFICRVYPVLRRGS